MYRRPSILICAAILALQSVISFAQPIAITQVRLDPNVSGPYQSGGGAYRYVANPQDPTIYHINTPYAALDLRGSIVEVITEGGNCERIRLIRGSVRVTTMWGQSNVLTEPNTVVTACALVPGELLAMALLGSVGGTALAIRRHHVSPPINPLVSPN